MVKIEQFVVDGLGHQSYLVMDDESGAAAVVDPRRDIDVYLQAAQRAGVRITHVLETHIHNDYISGARELSAQTGATVVASALDHLHYGCFGVHDGQRFSVGNLTFQALATPGHTPAHTSYLLYTAGNEQPESLFSGGSLLAGNAGRTDLLGPEMTLTLTRQQYHSLMRLLHTLPGQVYVYPTHGSGSFCMSSGSSSARSTTIAQERLVNPAALAPDEAAFVEQQLAGYTVYPTYYRYMGPINRQGPRILGYLDGSSLPQPPTLDAQTVRNWLQQGMPLIDGRRREDFAGEHIPGSLNIALDSSFATYVGWLLPFNVPLLLLIEDEAGRREAVVQLLRIGYEQVQGYLDGGIAAWKAAALPTDCFESIDIATLYQRWSRGGEGEWERERAAKARPYQDRSYQDRFYLLDVRRPDEWRSGHVPGARHIHLSDLPARMHELPEDEPITVMCHSGHRAAIAASMIAASGRSVTAVRGGMGDWLQAGFPRQEEVESEEAYLASLTGEQAHQPLSP